jgi:hypothetical protein
MSLHKHKNNKNNIKTSTTNNNNIKTPPTTNNNEYSLILAYNKKNYVLTNRTKAFHSFL